MIIMICKTMHINKKIVICQECRYFPTQIDQHKIKIRQSHLVWICPACQKHNKYKKQFVLLPQSNYLKVDVSNLLTKYCQIKEVRKFLIVLRRKQEEKIAYYVPQRKEDIQQQLQISLIQLQIVDQLMKESEWLEQYRKKKAAIRKFISPKVENKRFVMEDEYTVYLLQSYLKRQHQKLKLQDQKTQMQVEVLLQTSKQTFLFKITLFDGNTEQQLSNFLLINALITFNFQPIWLSKLHKSIINKHIYNNCLQVRQWYQIVIMNVSGPQEALIFPQPDQEAKNAVCTYINTSQTEIPNIIEQTSIINIIPPNTPTFKDYIDSIQPEQERFLQKIDIFYTEKRSDNVLVKTLTNNFQNISNILCNNRGFNINIDEQSFKKIILTSMENIKIKRSVSLIKIVGTFNTKEENSIILYTFNWSETQQQKGYQIFEQSQTHFSQQFPSSIYSPFSKKNRHLVSTISDFSHHSIPKKQSQSQDDYISL